MDKAVKLRFKNRFEMIEFRTTIGVPWSAVNLDDLELTSPLGEKEIELALNTYNAEVVTGVPNKNDIL